MSNTPKAVILIVDDTPANLRLLAGMLTQQNYKARPTPRASAALKSAQLSPPDLILLDINMPEMNGYEVCRRLKADERTCDIPIIFISALGEINDKVKAFAAGGVDYITKPFQIEEVLARVETHLTLRRLQQQLQDANEVLEQRVAERTAQLEARTVELAQLNEAYECFVPREFLQLLHKDNIIHVKLGDQIQQSMSVMFCDIRSFTTLSEKMTPQENFNFLNSYLSRVSPIIRQHNGFIDKYIGDAVMALFPNNPEDAVQCAIQMLHEVKHYNIERKATDYEPIEIGIGIHTGSMMLGIIGEEKRKQGTVISDAVNLADRLEGLTKRYGASIVISQQTLKGIANRSRYNYRFLDTVQVKGKHRAVSVFEIFDGNTVAEIEQKLRSKTNFEEGLSLYYDKNFARACVKFDDVLKQNPKDKAAQFYLERAAHFMVHGISSDWSGVEVLNEK